MNINLICTTLLFGDDFFSFYYEAMDIDNCIVLEQFVIKFVWFSFNLRGKKYLKQTILWIGLCYYQFVTPN